MPPFVRNAHLPLGIAFLLTVPNLARANDAQTPTTDHHSDDGWTEHVLGGSQVSPGDWPDTAGVLFAGELGCTGTLVAPRVVLTAGHCIDASVDKVLLNSVDAAQGGEEIAVVQTIAYPNWETTYDVGILILASDSTVPPRIIARGCAIDQYYTQGAAVEIVGYGATDPQGEQYGTRLLRGSTTITDPTCSSDSSCNASVSPGGELIAGGNGVDSCFGDSGGPVYLEANSGHYLIGVTSRGLDSSTTPCGGGGIYTRADAVATWIEEQSGATLAMADCQNDGTDPGEPGAGGEPGEPGDSDGPDGPSDGQSGDGTESSSGGAISGGCSTGGGSSGGSMLLLGLFALVLVGRRQRHRQR